MMLKVLDLLLWLTQRLKELNKEKIPLMDRIIHFEVFFFLLGEKYSMGKGLRI